MCLFVGDHALIDLGCIGHFNPKLITVRSKSRDLLSTDSTAVSIMGNRQARRASKMVQYNMFFFSSLLRLFTPDVSCAPGC